MVQTADFWRLPDCSELGGLNRSRFWGIHLQRQMCPPVVIVVHVGSQHTAQMPLVQYDHMIEGVSADAADDPLTRGILPW
jgi:hypothetical protein